MTNVIRWPKHIAYRCPPGCEKDHCMFCSGGLFSCTTCNLAEGDLTTDCCGEPVGPYIRAEVYAGRCDYTRRGGWEFKELIGHNGGSTCLS